MAIVTWFAISAVIGLLLAKKAGREQMGAVLGLLLGPLGWLLAATLKPNDPPKSPTV